MAIKISGKGLSVKDKVIGKRKGYIDNPVEDILNDYDVRLKRYDKSKIDIKQYLSREDIAILQRMPPAHRKQILHEFFNTPEYKKLEKVLENKPEDNIIKSSINLSEPAKLQNTVAYTDEYMYSGRKSIYKNDGNIHESKPGSISLSKNRFSDSDEKSYSPDTNISNITSKQQANNYNIVKDVKNKSGDNIVEDTNHSIDDTGDVSLHSYHNIIKDTYANYNEDVSDIESYTDVSGRTDTNKRQQKYNTKIKLSEENSGNNNRYYSFFSNSGNSKEVMYHSGQYYSEEKAASKVAQYEQTASTIVNTTAKGAETVASTGAAASTAGTSEIVKAAGKAIKKYADTIKQAVEQTESVSNNISSNSSEDNNQGESITAEADSVLGKLTAIVLTATSLLFASIGVVFIPLLLLIMCIIAITTLIVTVISSVAGVITSTVNKAANGIKMYLLSENTISYVDDMREAADDNEILNYVNYLMAIMEVESHGNGNDPMQSSESAGLPPNGFDNPNDSIRQGVYYFACCINKANDEGCDLMSAVQAYNYGTGFIDYVADNGGQYTLDIAISFAQQHSGGMQVDYSNPIAVDYNGGWRYAYGNMFYAQLVSQYIYSYEDDAVQKIVDEAMKYYGWEYTWGGSNPDEGFDCSGLVQWCYGIAGIDLPRTSREQWEWCEEISVEDIVPGDLLFYQNESSDGEIGHVAIYIGDGKVYEAGDPIGVYDNNDSWHQDNLLHAGRVIHFEPEENSESSDE